MLHRLRHPHLRMTLRAAYHQIGMVKMAVMTWTPGACAVPCLAALVATALVHLRRPACRTVKEGGC